jgi:hypothetical protein
MLAQTFLCESSGSSFNVILRNDARFDLMSAHHRQRDDVTVFATQ